VAKGNANMKWIEVIQLRSIDGNRKLLESKLNKLIDDVGGKSKKQIIMVFNRVLIDTDYSIQIFHESNKVENTGSPLGIRLANALKEFVLVNHSVWVDMHNK
jgi:hypothetical protein